MIHYPLNDGIGKIELIDYMGSDLQIVNDARVSYGKQQEVLGASDIRLLDYLIKHKHYSPLRGVVFKFLVTAPLFICRQWWRHATASCYVEEQRGWNEQSFRYVEVEDQFYIPELRSQSTTNKQGSSEIIDDPELKTCYQDFTEMSYVFYEQLLDRGVSKEIARTILPSCIYTQFRWTASLQTLLYFIQLRDAPDSQWEIQQYAKSIQDLITPYVPYTLEVYKKYATI